MACLLKQFSINHRVNRKLKDPEYNKMYEGYSNMTLTFIPSNKLPLSHDVKIPYEVYLHEDKIIEHVQGTDNCCHIGGETSLFGIVYFGQSEVIELIMEPTYEKFIELIGERGNYKEIFEKFDDKEIDKCLF